MSYAELIQQRVQILPLEKQAEVFDFVEFIPARSQAVHCGLLTEPCEFCKCLDAGRQPRELAPAREVIGLRLRLALPDQERVYASDCFVASGMKLSHR